MEHEPYRDDYPSIEWGDVEPPQVETQHWAILQKRRDRKRVYYGQVRAIFQHGIGRVMQYPDQRDMLQELLGLDDEEMDILNQFSGDVSSHLLERLID